ncbi:MAG: GNAT family N-acetyltransferase [Planctomycetes bacterium]|nr:GNAT family N-acetyltransferase [Planctomycetota bacterium]MCB9910785.1 GNAT family N-acetyltransferase [Planctomycetota bacterium]MCB9912812.1 GNAT family N-acetyltransferase [Planctomycetota bacterium]
MDRAPKLPSLQAQRLQLRWLEDADIPDLYAIFSNPEVARYWSKPPMTEPQQASDLLASIRTQFASGSLFQWGLATLGHDRIVGTCTLASIDIQNRRAEIGYALNREFWGQGLMLEALQTLLQHAFGAMDLNRVEADIDPRNESSIQLVERLGFQREGYLRQRWIVAGEICDTVLYGLLRADWSGV